MAVNRVLRLAAMPVTSLSRHAAVPDQPAAQRDILFAMSVGHLPETTGGVESTTHELCRALGRRGWRPAMLCGTQAADAAPEDALGYAVERRRDPLAALPATCRRLRPAIAVVQLGRVVPLAQALVEAGVPTLLYLHNLELAE